MLILTARKEEVHNNHVWLFPARLTAFVSQFDFLFVTYPVSKIADLLFQNLDSKVYCVHTDIRLFSLPDTELQHRPRKDVDMRVSASRPHSADRRWRSAASSAESPDLGMNPSRSLWRHEPDVCGRRCLYSVTDFKLI